MQIAEATSHFFSQKSPLVYIDYELDELHHEQHKQYKTSHINQDSDVRKRFSPFFRRHMDCGPGEGERIMLAVADCYSVAPCKHGGDVGENERSTGTVWVGLYESKEAVSEMCP